MYNDPCVLKRISPSNVMECLLLILCIYVLFKILVGDIAAKFSKS